MYRHLPAIATIGSNMGSRERRADWVAMIRLLHDASSPGGPIDDWVFHGTSLVRSRSVREIGVTTTEVLMRDGDIGEDDEPGERWTDGSYWGTAAVAAFYAEDLILSLDNPDLELSIIAIRLSDLQDEGALVADELTLDSPLDERLGRSAYELAEAWGRSEQTWADGFEIYGSVVCLAPVAPDCIVVLTSAAEAQEFTLTVERQLGVSPETPKVL